MIIGAVLAMGLPAVAQTNHDFADTLADGKVLLYTVTDQQQACVSVRGLWLDEENPATRYTGALVIPSTVTHDGTQYTVTAIGDSAFTRQDAVTSVSIPPTVVSIGNIAFHACSGLTEIVLPEGVQSLGMYAFGHCSAATSLSIPSTLTVIGRSAFEGLGSPSAPAAVTFNNARCDIGPWGFSAASLSSLDLGTAIRSIGRAAFSNVFNLQSVTLPSGMEYVADSVFMYSIFLERVTLPDDMDTLPGSMFESCIRLERVENMPAALLEIGDRAFFECTHLTELEIPAGVTSIGAEAFRYTQMLYDIQSRAAVPPSLGANALANVSSMLTVTVPCGSIEAYQADSQWGTVDIVDDCDGVGDVPADGVAVAYDGRTVTVFGACGEDVSAYDMAGRLMASGMTTIDASRWPSGIYLLRIRTPMGTALKKLTVAR